MGLYQERTSPRIGLAIKVPVLSIGRKASYRQHIHAHSIFYGKTTRKPAFMQRFNWDDDQHYILATHFSKHGSMSNLLGHASPPFSSLFLISPSVTGRPLLMMCNTGTLRPSLANLTTVWWSCPLKLFIGWWILPRWERFCVSDLSSK